MIDCQRVIQETSEIVEIFLSLQGVVISSNYYRGGYLSIFNRQTGELELKIRIGEKLWSGNWLIHSQYSEEQGKRLCENCDKFGHFSSHQSRDSNKGKRGGAIATEKYIFSFAGLGEAPSEGIVLALATILGFIKIPEAREIAKLSNNLVFDVLLQIKLDTMNVRVAVL